MQTTESIHKDAHDQRQRRQLRSRRQVHGHGRTSALVDIREPHVKRHRAKLERDSDDQECYTEP